MKQLFDPIDESAQIDIKSEFGLKQLRETDYSIESGRGINVNKFISDLKKCVAMINYANPIFVVKDYDSVKDSSKLSILDLREFKQLMSTINIGKYYKNNKWKNATAYDIYNEGKNKNHISFDGMRFYDSRPNIYSFYTGFDNDVLDECDEQMIKPYLDHIREIIADGDEKIYQYIINWLSFIIQNPDAKTGVALVITGDQGTGKNVFTNQICKLLSRYANPNLTNIDSIVGKFNTSLENMKLIVCNELNSADTNKYLNSDSLKSVITESEIQINAKNVKPRQCQNVVNLIMLSNNQAPVKIESNDRRYLVVKTSNKHRQDTDYFDKLCKSFNKSFYDNLLTYFVKNDISQFNPRIIPLTDAKKLIQEQSRPSYELFIQDYNEQFVEGIERSVAYNYYKTWADDNGFVKANVKTFKGNIISFVVEKQISRDGRRPHVYLLKNEYYSQFGLNADGKSIDRDELDESNEPI